MRIFLLGVALGLILIGLIWTGVLYYENFDTVITTYRQSYNIYKHASFLIFLGIVVGNVASLFKR